MKSYNDLVLKPNQEANKALKTLGMTIKVTYFISKMDPDYMPDELFPYLEAIDKNKADYKKAAANVRKSKAGNYSSFYLRQYLYKLYKADNK